MRRKLMLKGQILNVDPSTLKGEGGEARVYLLQPGLGVKLYKLPDDPYYDALPNADEARAAVKKKIVDLQKKLVDIPKNLPEKLVRPLDLVTDASGMIVGYALRFVDNATLFGKYADPGFANGGIFNQKVFTMFQDLHPSVSGAHKVEFVFGDFNYLNLLERESQAYVIDVDAGQFGKYFCQMFTPRFADPLLCEWDPVAKYTLKRPHNKNSDWYAFSLMLFECLLGSGLYDGVFKPKDVAKKVVTDARPLHRISVFNSEVKYPKPAIPYGRLSDDLLHYFHLLIEKDQRGEFPLQLLMSQRWTTCTVCGIGHSRNTCPGCAQPAPAAVMQKIQIRGKVTATRLFQTKGVIVQAVFQNGKLHYLYHENGQYKREGGRVAFSEQLQPKMRVRIKNEDTIAGLNGRVMYLPGSGAASHKLSADVPPTGETMFDTNEKALFRADGGYLYREGQFGSESLGSVMHGHTRFWVGNKFGFGFYRAGDLNIFFVFGADANQLKDSIPVSPIRGKLLDAWCTFSDQYGWFFYQSSDKGIVTNYCTVFTDKGDVVATHEARDRDGSWLGGIRGKLAIKDYLLAATDDGLVSVKPVGPTIQVTKEFPDTADFVDSASTVLPAQGGLHVVSRNEVYFLKIA